MRNVSNQYIETMKDRRDFYAEAEITFANGVKKTVNKEDMWLSGNSFTHSAGGSSFPIGMLIAKRITFSLNNEDDQWSEYDFFGAKIQLFTRFKLDDGKIESIDMGEFTVITPEAYGTTVEVTAMDESYKTDIEYSTFLTYPLSLGEALRDSCATCGITLLTQRFANDDFIIQSIPEKITHRQFIGMCAMIAGGNAVLDEYNRLKIITYDLSALSETGLDGGQFDKLGLSEYVTGDTADGGSFAPWDVGYIADGGTFGDRKNIHVLYEIKSGMTVGVDDVVITGVQMTDEEDEVHLYGKEGYVISIENQLAAGKEDEAVQRIGDIIVGLRFRPFTAEHIAYPLAEFMDPAFIIDRKQNVYQTVLTDIEFKYFGFTSLKCTADSPLRNSSKFNNEAAKAVIEARKLVKEERTEREKAVETLAKELANSSGLYITPEQQPDGSKIYYMHDKPTLEESMIVWKLTIDAFGISTDGGKTYPYGLDVSGMAILNKIYTIGLDADYINTGALRITDGKGNDLFYADYNTKEVRIVANSFSLSSGQTIESIAEDKSKSAANSALSSAKDYADTAVSGEASRAKEQEEILSSAINVNAKNIELEVSRAKGEEEKLSSAIILNSDSIAAEVKRAQNQEIELAAAIKVAADSIDLKVSKGDVSSQLSVESGAVTIKSNRFSWESTYSSMDANGRLTCSNILINGGTIKIPFPEATSTIYYTEISSSGVYTPKLVINTGSAYSSVNLSQNKANSISVPTSPFLFGDWDSNRTTISNWCSNVVTCLTNLKSALTNCGI